jgi:serine phosphatase RsbU (regulator of sigma subunit)
MLLPPEPSMQISGVTYTVGTISLSAWALLCTAPFIAFWPWNRIAPRLRPLAACCFLWGLADFVNFSAQAANFSFVTRNLHVLIEIRTIISGAAIFTLLLLLFRDQRKLIEERAVLAGEMQSARTIQRMLSPAHIPAAPSIAINVDFRPMRDVGGDFYLSRVLHDGRQRLIVGDVSGKGTAAAMTAALLIGAAEDHDALSPGELLAHLDRVLRTVGVGGFATCLCADLTSGGKATVANAGHLPPYCRGRELPLPPGLPLGVAEDVAYAETVLEVAPGETLTFVSDGVVEARNASGELLGFDRTADLSTRSAGEIAATAQSFGQEDDITVITLTFASAA